MKAGEFVKGFARNKPKQAIYSNEMDLQVNNRMGLYPDGMVAGGRPAARAREGGLGDVRAAKRGRKNNSR